VKYTVIIEKGATSYGAYVPDLPGCVAVADSEQQIRKQIREAIDLHIQGLQQEGLPVPPPRCLADEVEVDLHAA
jgi:predicted RNase H-like HicB family nuclease